MPASALGLALAAACLHALWNLLLARSRDVGAATAVALGVAVVAFAPAAAAGWRVEAAAVPWLAASAALELVYFALLVRAYGRSDLSLIYPAARGSAPVLVLAGAVAFGHDPSLWEAAGVAVVAAGVVLVRGGGRAPAAHLALALAIGATIAGYTLVDKEGVQHASAVTYLELSMLPVAAIALVTARGRLRSQLNAATVVAGLATFGAYVLVLLALRLAPAAPVAAVRETSVVIAVALAAATLGERVTRLRFAGAAFVVAGVALLSF